MNEKVFVGLSGGVDSSVSASLLQKQGYIVEGVFIRGWYPNWIECNWRREEQDAMRVCALLGIPFHSLDLKEVYKKEVIDYMIAEYKKGNTPNADIFCNKYVKFGGFFDFAMDQGADYIATGHYARIQDAQLLMGVDEQKDQSYFLWAIPQSVLKKTLFPIGEFRKDKVRKIAQEFGLHTAEKKDSQGICFLGKVDMREFLQHYIETKKGDVVDEEGRVIGQHDGAELYTLGQRHGFRTFQKHTEEKPKYVVKKDIEKNILVVAENIQETPSSVSRIHLEHTNWVSGVPKVKTQYMCRFRYRQKLIRCTVENIQEHTIEVLFEVPQQFVARGQSCVVYDGDICLGGGSIV